MKGYPVFLIGLESQRCIVVGDGREAERKIDGLLECDAAVTVIAAQASERIRSLAARGRLTWIDRDYRRGDLRGAFLVIVEGREAGVNGRTWEEAQAEGTLINVMDDTEHCNFIAGSVLRQGALTVALSTSGCAPALAVRLRERLQRELGPEYAAFLELMSKLRKPLAERYTDFEERRALWYELVDSDIIDHLRAGRPDLARQSAERIVALPVSEPQAS